MLLPRLEEIRRALTPFHFFNAILALAFPLLRSSFLCDYVFATEGNERCEIDSIAGMFLFIRADILAGTIYILACLIITVLFPEPAYNGPEQVTYFQGSQLFEELTRNRNTIWIIQFFTTWSPECKHTSPVFAELSQKYTLPNMKFGKLDIGRWSNEGERFRVNAHPMSRQLPTICVFK
uniref:Thioredoxin domain-containing protein n=1 Tax=Caenorhabditis tropicalis TaxID=1561998 RepID=A0A1I7TEL8_9PELO